MKFLKVVFVSLTIMLIGFLKAQNLGSGIRIEIPLWKNEAMAAYSIIHDDMGLPECDGIFKYADTMAFNRGIKITGAAVAGFCIKRQDTLAPLIKQWISHGHELASHSWNHGAAVDLGWTPKNWDYEKDVVKSKEYLEKFVPGYKVTFFVFPYDAYEDKNKSELRKAGYLGCRAGKKMHEDRGVNCSTEGEFDPFSDCLFDVFLPRKEQDSISRLYPQNPPISIYTNENDDVEYQHLKSIIQCKGWGIQEMHSVDDIPPWGWGHISVDRYRRLLDTLVMYRNVNKLWIDTPTTVIKYIMTRNAMKKLVVKDSIIDFSEVVKHLDPRYGTAVTIKIIASVSASPPLMVQGNRFLKLVKTTGGFLTNVNPFLGNVLIKRSVKDSLK